VEYQDYYATLGVPKDATEKQIRSAYRKLARKYHPDVNPDNKEAEDQFKKINEAYEVLSDPEKRRKYDELGARWKEYEQYERAGAGVGRDQAPFNWADFGSAPTGAGAGRRGGYRTVSEEELRDLFGDESPFSDFFETFFGGPTGQARGRRRQARAPRRGSDVEHSVEISLADAYRGTTVALQLQDPEGTTRRIEVKIPPGVDNGSRIRVAGQGSRGRDGGPGGDLYLVTRVRPDPRFERSGSDLRTKVSVPFEIMMLGGETRVPTPDGRWLALSIPETSQDGRVFRLRGQGMPRFGQPERRGDLFAEVHALLPSQLTQRQRALVEELAQALRSAEPGVRSS
jgi:curved DNA-binding protein